MIVGRLFVVLVLAAAAGTSLGCSTAAESAPESHEAEAVAFEHRSLAQITANDLIAAYRATLAREVGEARGQNPDVVEVSAAGLAVFAGYKQTLKGSLAWYFRATSTDRIAVAAIEESLVSAVRQPIEDSVGADGFVLGSQLNGHVPPEMVWAVDDARFDAALRNAKAPRGIDLPDLFDHYRAEWDYESLFLPVSVTRKPTDAEISKVFHLDLGGLLWGDVARERIHEVFDDVVLAPALASGAGIKEVWYTSESWSDSENHYAFFLDEHDQLWGFSLTYQVD